MGGVKLSFYEQRPLCPRPLCPLSNVPYVPYLHKEGLFHSLYSTKKDV